MLRSGKVPITKLEAATSEVMVQIPKERIPLLDEIYRVAQQEERYQRGELRMCTEWDPRLDIFRLLTYSQLPIRLPSLPLRRRL